MAATDDPTDPAHPDPATDRMATLEGEDRPWGRFDVLVDADDHKVKRITVHPGQRLSYQYHHRRAEHWSFVRGRGVMTLDDEEFDVGAGRDVDIPVGARHRIRNPGPEPLVFVEIQRGDYFGEDDIVRLDDDYGRGENP